MNLNKLNNDWSEAVLASGRLDELLSELGADVRPSRGGLRGPCPVHLGGDSNFVVGTDGKLFPVFWACHSHRCHKAEGLKGNLIGLVRGALTGDPDRPASMTRVTAFMKEFLAEGGDIPRTRPRTTPPPRKTLSLSREQVRQRLEIPSPYFLSRGFSPAVLDKFDIGESARLSRAVVPVYDQDGRAYVGFLSRSTKPTCAACDKCHHPTAPCRYGELRWQVEGGFPKGDYLYNLAAAFGRDSRPVLLVEGVGDVLRAAEAGVVAVSCFGNAVSDLQAVKLSMLNRRILVAFDNDEVGERAALELVPRLRRDGVHAEVKHPPASFKDIGEMPAEAVSEWLAALPPAWFWPLALPC